MWMHKGDEKKKSVNTGKEYQLLKKSNSWTINSNIKYHRNEDNYSEMLVKLYKTNDTGFVA